MILAVTIAIYAIAFQASIYAFQASIYAIVKIAIVTPRIIAYLITIIEVPYDSTVIIFNCYKQCKEISNQDN